MARLCVLEQTQVVRRFLWGVFRHYARAVRSQVTHLMRFGLFPRTLSSDQIRTSDMMIRAGESHVEAGRFLMA